MEALSWSPETIALELHDDFQVDIPQSAIDKIMAGIVILTSDDFFHRLPVFNHVCNVLSGDTFDPMTFEPATADEIAWGITEAVLLSPPEETDVFTDEIRGFIAKVLDLEGISRPPDVLRFAVPSDKPDPLSHLTEDPEMYQAFDQQQLDNKTAVDEQLRENLFALIKQIESLPLQTGDSADLAKRLRGSLGGQ